MDDSKFIGIIPAGLIMKNMNPNWVWYFGGITMLIAVVGYLLLIPIASARLNVVDKEIESSLLEDVLRKTEVFE